MLQGLGFRYLLAMRFHRLCKRRPPGCPQPLLSDSPVVRSSAKREPLAGAPKQSYAIPEDVKAGLCAILVPVAAAVIVAAGSSSVIILLILPPGRGECVNCVGRWSLGKSGTRLRA